METEDPLKAGAVAEIPKEVAQKFEVRDSGEPIPQATPTPTPTPTPAAKKRRGKKKKASSPTPAPASIPEPVVYPNRRPAHEIFWEGERMVYEATYIGTPAGEFAMEVMPFKYVNGRKVYHFQAHARTSSLYSLFYRLDDLMETYMDYEGLFSHRFRILQDETNQKRDGLELNDSEKRETFYWNRWAPGPGKPGEPREEKIHGVIEPFSQDWISMTYFLRAQPLKVGDIITVPVISEGKMTIAKISVIRRESIETELGGFDSVVLRPDEIATNGVVKKAGESYFWFTNDDRHFLIKAEIRVRIGAIYAKIKKITPGTPP